MPDYRIYFIKPGGRLAGPPKVISCNDDDEAKTVARQFVDGLDIELWEGARVVAKFPHMDE